MPEAPTVPNMVAQSMGRILRDSTHTKYTVQYNIDTVYIVGRAHIRQSNTTILWLNLALKKTFFAACWKEKEDNTRPANLEKGLIFSFVQMQQLRVRIGDQLTCGLFELARLGWGWPALEPLHCSHRGQSRRLHKISSTSASARFHSQPSGQKLLLSLVCFL